MSGAVEATMKSFSGSVLSVIHFVFGGGLLCLCCLSDLKHSITVKRRAGQKNETAQERQRNRQIERENETNT